MKTVTIKLEFEADEVTGVDVVDYLNYLIEDESLAYEISDKHGSRHCSLDDGDEGWIKVRFTSNLLAHLC